MDISGKRKRNDNNQNEEDEIQKFSEIVEKFRAPYNWFRARMSTHSAAATHNGGDRKKKKKKPSGSGEDEDDDDDDVWMPCFLLQDFEEEEVIKSWKARAVPRPETAGPAAEFESVDGGRVEGEKGKKEEKLNLRLSL
ncbi:hypothetical protein Csa_002705 [Cucumis sativus]|uniref:Uncharacterized protein n=1 Tax=Cucumis sativus TaxID=3659 RepID=A0A0A0LCY6_CUCSA|nr:hypothetical protein Csa_002705 [Cucumis sativus]